MRRTRSAPHSAAAIYRIPLLVALISTLGLASALFGDGVWDLVSWLGLGLPIALAAICWRNSATRAAADDGST
jgi:hypothetical protein